VAAATTVVSKTEAVTATVTAESVATSISEETASFFTPEMVNAVLRYRALSMHVGFATLQHMLEELGLPPSEEETILELNRDLSAKYKEVKRQLVQYAQQQQQQMMGVAAAAQYPTPQTPVGYAPILPQYPQQMQMPLPPPLAMAPTLPTTMSSMAYYNAYSDQTTSSQQLPQTGADMSAVYAEHAARGDGWNRDSGGRNRGVGKKGSSSAGGSGSVALDPYEGQYDEKGFPLHATIGDRVDRISPQQQQQMLSATPPTMGSPRWDAARKEGYVTHHYRPHLQRSNSKESLDHTLTATAARSDSGSRSGGSGTAAKQETNTSSQKQQQTRGGAANKNKRDQSKGQQQQTRV